MLKRFTISQKNSMKPIILSDESDTTIEEDCEKVKEIFKTKNIYTFRTSNDFLVGRPSELQSILISEINLKAFYSRGFGLYITIYSMNRYL